MASRMRGLLSQSNATQAQAAILHDPTRAWAPKVTRGLVRVRVLRNQTYLDGRFHDVGAVVPVPEYEAKAAVTAGYAALPEPE